MALMRSAMWVAVPALVYYTWRKGRRTPRWARYSLMLLSVPGMPGRITKMAGKYPGKLRSMASGPIQSMRSAI